MIERFKFLRNIGPFDNVAPQQENSLKSFSLVYGGTVAGKRLSPPSYALWQQMSPVG